MRAVRRVRAMVVVALAGVLVLAGCTTEPSRPSGGSGSTNAGAYPVSIDTMFGEVTIAEPPKRVVALGWGDAAVAVKLGVQPVGVADWLDFGGDGLGPWMQQGYAKPPAKLGTLEVDLEKLAALQPDLILDTRASGKKERHERLSVLGVPVVGPPPGADSYRTSWQQQLEMIGQALGKQDRARTLRDQLNAKFAEAARQHPEFAGATAVLAARTARSWSVYVNDGLRQQFMHELGFVTAPQVRDLPGNGFSAPISQERLGLLNADLTVVFPIGVGAAAVTDNPLYRAVPSVRAGHDVVLSDRTISLAFSSGTVVGLSYALDKAVPLFSRALGA